MSFNKSSKSNKSNNEGFESVKLNLADYQYGIKNVRQLSDITVAFTLDLGIGISLYSVKLIDGKNGIYVAAAESKGNNGIYYRNYGLHLTEESVQLIIDEIQKVLNN